jgi:hypothetical protein
MEFIRFLYAFLCYSINTNNALKIADLLMIRQFAKANRIYLRIYCVILLYMSEVSCCVCNDFRYEFYV